MSELEKLAIYRLDGQIVPEDVKALVVDAVPGSTWAFLDAVGMRALAKAPEQRYDSAEEMDADLARVARGVSVSRETEDAMTQVLSGAGIAHGYARIRPDSGTSDFVAYGVVNDGPSPGTRTSDGSYVPMVVTN